jgi:hypothetical protein
MLWCGAHVRPTLHCCWYVHVVGTGFQLHHILALHGCGTTAAVGSVTCFLNTWVLIFWGAIVAVYDPAPAGSVLLLIGSLLLIGVNLLQHVPLWLR